MTPREELNLILKLIGKYNLPLSPILEYAVKEKMEEYPEEKLSAIILNDDKAEDDIVVNEEVTSNNISVDTLSDELRIVDYGERTIAVVGNTKPHKDALKSIGGYFVYRTQWGPAWVFRNKKRDVVQAYINGDTSVITREEEEKQDEPQKKEMARYIIRVKYPDGRVFERNYVWETLVDVIEYAGPEKVRQLNIMNRGCNLVSPKLNENPIYSSTQKKVSGGLFVLTKSSTDEKYKQIVRINIDCKLSLEIEKVYTGETGKNTDASRVINVADNCYTYSTKKGVDSKEDKRIGYSVRLFPSQLIGEIVRVRKDAKGTKKLVVKTTNGDIVEVDDLPYLYEVLKRN